MKHIPNLITALRLMLVPVVWKLMWDGVYDTALAIGVFATASDAVDGWIARKLQATSKIGAILDPIADKLLVAGTYVILWHRQEIPGWLVGIIIGRDVLILLSAAIAYWLTPIRDFPPSRWGKLSTFIQIITLLVILVNRSGKILMYDVEEWMRLVCAAVTVWSGVHYLWLGIKRLRAADRIAQ